MSAAGSSEEEEEEEEDSYSSGGCITCGQQVTYISNTPCCWNIMCRKCLKKYVVPMCKNDDCLANDEMMCIVCLAHPQNKICRCPV